MELIMKTYIQINLDTIQTSETLEDGRFVSGVIRKNSDEWNALIADETANVTWLDEDAYLAEQQSQIALSQALTNREAVIYQSTVTTLSGNVYHADKESIVMLGNSRQRLDGLPLNTHVKWSLYGTPSGFMSDVTHEEIIEAHNLAVDQLAANWEIPSEE